jgi:hypothetical protein
MVFPLEKGCFQTHKTQIKKDGTEGAIRRKRGQKSGRIVTQITRLTGTSG